MLRWPYLGLLGLLIAGPVAYAQDTGGVPGPGCPRPDIQRLPSVGPLALPPPAEELLPLAEGLPPPAHEAEQWPQPAGPAAEYVLIEPEPEPAPKPWEASFELGFDGTEGNSQTFNLRLGFDAKRTTPDDVLSLDLDYRRNTTESLETAHRAFLDWRYERLFRESPWTCFLHGTFDYDEFKMFDARVTADAGLGYQWIKTESTCLASRIGGGFSHEIGGPDDRYVPEMVFGLDFEHRLSERQKLTLSAEYMPDVTDFGDFRLNARAGWELLVDRQMNLSLKLSVLDRYDSTPSGAKPNDLDYAAVLLWKF